ncbi:MAG: hypothetical protein OEY36_05370 [Gammaproteobacteria bacterium]|nr:hypothetical protein [Gammaproteobacteria bacterium]
MHSVNLYINESLNEANFQAIKSNLMADSHVVNVAYHSRMPHEMLVEYDEAYVSPSSIVDFIASQGLHVDVTGG